MVSSIQIKFNDIVYTHIHESSIEYQHVSKSNKRWFVDYISKLLGKWHKQLCNLLVIRSYNYNPNLFIEHIILSPNYGASK